MRAILGGAGACVKRLRARAPTPTSRGMDHLARSIFDAALEEAARTGWHDLRLHALAARLDVPLGALLARFRDADALADAHFEGLLAAMLVAAEDEAGFLALPPRARAEAAAMRWFEAAAPHRRVTLAMIREKAWPSHPHHWVPMVFNLSRLVHWWREAARLDRGGVARMAEEVALTAAFLAALSAFAADGEAGLPRTRAALARVLRAAPLG
jgi:AcrR family transcriptional regulator